MTDWGITAVTIIKVTFSYKETYYSKKLQEGSFGKLICRKIRNFGLTKLIFRKTRRMVLGRETGHSCWLFRPSVISPQCKISN